MAVTVTAAGGFQTARVQSAASVNNTLVKSSQGRLMGYHVTNTNAAVRYLKIFDKATTPVAGTDVPLYIIALPSNQPIYFCTDEGVSMSTGIGFAITAAAGDADTTAVGANDVTGAVWFA